nr:PREDICTED: E3 ubiquitin-protein ligase DTX4-like [Apteryx mantelli mantelli]
MLPPPRALALRHRRCLFCPTVSCSEDKVGGETWLGLCTEELETLRPWCSTLPRSSPPGKTPEEVLKKYLQKVRHPPDEDCTICMERLSAPSGYKGPQPAVKPDLVGKLAKCGHVFHLHCLVAMYNNGNKDGSLQCPTCKTIYGVKTGTQPPGKMEYHIIPHALPGHSDCKTIRIIYNIPPGVQVRPGPVPRAGGWVANIRESVGGLLPACSAGGG